MRAKSLPLDDLEARALRAEAALTPEMRSALKAAAPRVARTELSASRHLTGGRGRRSVGIEERTNNEERADQETEERLSSLDERWFSLPLPDRPAFLVGLVREMWRKRFGFEWRDEWITWIRSRAMVDATRRAIDSRNRLRKRKGRNPGPRAFVIVWETRNPAPQEPPAKPSPLAERYVAACDAGNMRDAVRLLQELQLSDQLVPPWEGPWKRPWPSDPRTGSTIPPIAFLTWASLLAGNWPKVRSTATAVAVLKAERRNIEKVLERYGLQPIWTNEPAPPDWAEKLKKLPVRRQGPEKKK